MLFLEEHKGDTQLSLWNLEKVHVYIYQYVTVCIIQTGITIEPLAPTNKY